MRGCIVPQVYLWRTLQEIGFTMEQLRAFGETRTPEKALEMFQVCGGRLETQISKLQERQDTLQNGLKFCGPAYAVYLHDAVSVTRQEQYLLQFAVMANRTTLGN